MRVRRNWTPALLLGGAVVVAHLLDPIVFRYVRIEHVNDVDWGRMLRVMGFVPVWLAAGAALVLHQRTPWRHIPRSDSGLVVAGPLLSGITAELLKLIVRRRRPGPLGDYLFRPFTDRPFSTGGLGMPSSHAAVAFAAAAVLSHIFPRARIVWWTLAWGCAFTRVATGAHFLSDVVVAACIGWLTGALLWRWRARTTPARSTPAPAPQPRSASTT